MQTALVVERTGRRIRRYPLDGSSPTETREATEDGAERQGSLQEQALDALKGAHAFSDDHALPQPFATRVSGTLLSCALDGEYC